MAFQWWLELLLLFFVIWFWLKFVHRIFFPIKARKKRGVSTK